jgi:hypothetical protein
MNTSNPPTTHNKEDNESVPANCTMGDKNGDENVTTTAATQNEKNEKDKEKEEGKVRVGAGERKGKEEEDGDECPICLEILPKDVSQFNRMACCGNGMHKHCSEDLDSMKMGGNCPLCRAKRPTSEEDYVKQLRPWVKKKKTWALAMMGDKYYQGKGVKQSYEMARRLFEQAAQQGYGNAMYNLGVMYENSHGVAQSYETAAELYEQAAQQGHPSAMYNLGLFYAKGQGVEQSYERAFEYYEQAANLGDAQAQYNLGHMYYTGQGVEKDTAQARKWWSKAAAQGHANSIKNLKILEKNMK